MRKIIGGHGVVAKNVLREPAIPSQSKGLYAYLAGFAGNSDECYPSISLICTEMAMSKTSVYKYMDVLVGAGVVERKQTYNGNLKGKVIYRITDTAYSPRFPTDSETESIKNTVSEDLGIRKDRNPTDVETNNNSFNNNNINNSSIDYQQIADMYNNTCVSFPRLTVLSDRRKKAIKARLRQYSVEDFQRLFQMAENSSF